MTGWASAAVPALRSNETILLESGPMSGDQSSWMVSLKSLTFVINIPIFGLIANKFGRKWPLNFLGIQNKASSYMCMYTIARIESQASLTFEPSI